MYLLCVCVCVCATSAADLSVCLSLSLSVCVSVYLRVCNLQHSQCTWASIIGWTGGQVPPLFEVGGRNVFCPPTFGATNLIFSCLTLREMDISLRG